VGADAAFYLGQGQAVMVPKAPTEGWVRVYHGDAFLAVGEVQDDGLIAPRRLMTEG
jgi:tRNA pseudouridine55 synthase